MKKYIFILILGFLISLLSCTSNEDLNRQSNSNYKGNWNGSFNGDDLGSILFTVDNTGNLDGKITSDKIGSETISGYVFADGRFDLYSKNNFAIHGILVVNTSSGDWSRNQGNILYKGNYKINKK